jgi:sucrose-6-phosphate hydrolase SacC (GH32 family)
MLLDPDLMINMDTDPWYTEGKKKLALAVANNPYLYLHRQNRRTAPKQDTISDEVRIDARRHLMYNCPELFNMTQEQANARIGLHNIDTLKKY